MPACGPDRTGADAVLSRRRLHSVDTMETVVVQFGVGSWPEARVAVARSQLSNSDTLASGPAESPVELRIDLSGKGAVCG